MKQWAFTLPLILCVAANVACSSSTSKPTKGNTAGAAGSGTAGSAGSGTAGSSGSGTAGSGSDEVLLPIDMSGYMSAPDLGIQGAWYAYGDAIGPTGMPPGDCQMKGMHMDSECSNITAPAAGSFPNTAGAMQTTGTVEKVIDLVGSTGCPTTSASCDYSNMWGAGIGVDLNNAGNADGGTGTKMPYDATAHNVVGVAFDIALTDDLPGLRVEFPMMSTVDTAHIYRPGTGAQNYVSPVMAGHNRILFASDLAQPDYVAVEQMVAFDPSQMMSIQFHIPTSTSAAGTFDITVSNFSAIVAP